MAHRTTFAGLAAPDLGDSAATVLNGDFFYRNPDLIAQFLQIGAQTHRHDAHAALANPVQRAGVALASGGSLSAGTTYSVTYTLLDAHGGETLPAAAASLTTPGGIVAPSASLTATPEFNGGIMPFGSYAYAETYTDGVGGETTLGPTTWAYVPPGYASAQVQITFETLLPGVATRRLWRSYNGADWHLTVETAASAYLDSGFDPPDNPARPPSDNTTSGTAGIVATLPTAAAEHAIGSATAINLYFGADGTFSSPAFIGMYPTASAGSSVTISSNAPSTGAPPPVSTSIAGAAQINPDTDLLDWHWKRPVQTYGALPPTGNASADVRVVMAPAGIWIWNGSTWISAGGGGASGLTILDSIGTVFPNLDEVQFAGASGVTVSVASGVAGEAVVTVAGALGGGGLTSFEGSAGTASGTIRSQLAFAGSGAAQVQYTDQGGGSGLVLITVPTVAGPAGPPGASGATGATGTTGATGPQGQPGTAITAVDDGTTRVTPVQDILFTGAVVSNLGGGSAEVSITGGGGGAGGVTIGVDGPGGTPLVTPISDIRFIASGGASAGVTYLGGGSAQISISTTPTPCFDVNDTSGGSAMAGGAQATPLEFVGSGAASATVTRSGGSAVVTITVPTVTGATGPAGPPGSSAGGASTLEVTDTSGNQVQPTAKVTFAASGGLGLAVGSLGGGSAMVTIAPNPLTTWSLTATSTDGSSRLLAASASSFLRLRGNGLNEVIVDTSTRSQAIAGFGAGLTDSAAYVLWTTMSPAQRADLFKDLFDPVTGGLSMIRLPMGATDFVAGSANPGSFYTYDDIASGTDNALSGFSIAHDQKYIIPILREILAVNPNIRIIATPWTPPAWMKSTGSLLGGSSPTLNTSAYSAYAQYFVKFIQQYAAFGIPIWAVTPQNEPDTTPGAYPGCTFTASAEASFIGTFLGPAIDAANLNTKIIGGDTSTFDPTFAPTLEADATAGPYVAGVAYHAYQLAPSAAVTNSRKFPLTPMHMTEIGASDPTTTFPTNFARFSPLAIQTLRANVSSWFFWNLALNENYQPNPTYVTGREPVVVVPTTASGNVLHRWSYYVLQQMGKFIKPGAVRVGSTTPGSILSAAFQNPDGSMAVLLYSPTDAYTVISDGRTEAGAILTLKGGDFTTVTWAGQPALPTTFAPPPNDPTGFAVTGAGGALHLSWSEPTSPSLPATYQIGRATAPGAELPVFMVPAGSAYTDSSAIAGTPYWYSLTPYGEGGSGITLEASGMVASPGFVRMIGNAQNLAGGGQSATVGIVPSAATLAGNTIIVAVKTGGGASASVTDTQGNTYHQDVQTTLSGPVVTIFSCVNARSLGTGDQITVTNAGGSQGGWGAIAIEAVGVSVGVDKTGTGTGTSTTTLAVSQGTNTTAAHELVITAFGEGGSPTGTLTETPSGGWTQIGALAGDQLGVAYQVISAVGTQSVTWTANQSANNCGAIATYK